MSNKIFFLGYKLDQNQADILSGNRGVLKCVYGFEDFWEKTIRRVKNSKWAAYSKKGGGVYVVHPRCNYIFDNIFNATISAGKKLEPPQKVLEKKVDTLNEKIDELLTEIRYNPDVGTKIGHLAEDFERTLENL